MKRQDTEDFATMLALFGAILVAVGSIVALVKGDPLAMVIAGAVIVYGASAGMGDA